ENAPQAVPFELKQVRLLEGPFKAAEQADATYLLSLDPDRLLHNFRVNAGLPSTAKPLGGWEAPWIGLRGHFVGHYLSACALMYASTGDERFRQRADELVTELDKCQQALDGGYLSAFPAKDFDTLETKFTGVWAPYYTIHKIMAGLLDVHQQCGNPQALVIATKMADYFERRIDKLTPAQVEQMLLTTRHAPQNEFGGMSEVLHNLYGITREPRYLRLADVFDRQWFLQPLAEGKDKLEKLQANTHIAQVIGFARHYELTGDREDQLAAEKFWSIVTGQHSFVTGGNSFAEHFAAPGVEAKQLVPDTAESCNVYNMLKLTRHLFEWKPDAAYADYYERALYNHILASIDPANGMTTYFVSLKPGHFKVYSTPYDTFWCCTGTGVENHAKYGDSIYYRSQDDGVLWVNLYIASELNWAAKGVSVRQETKFPDEPRTALTFKTAKPVRLALKLRVPYWAEHGATVTINGQPQAIDAKPQSYLTLDREWKDGDKVELVLPMSLHLHRASDLRDNVAILYGPLVLAAELGTEGMPQPDQAREPTQYNKVATPAVPVLVSDSADPQSLFKKIDGESLEFVTNGTGKPADVRLQPLYRLHHQRYTVYWQLLSPTQWPQK
ncbi:MAG TPA: beta-L-arabinofuranosidase domain-containing protein, partial [Roseimicrobium sp.]|nr:beta-L-arabinofuranosidase domain-containing protein [Roseimicrobium sp.]